MVVMRELLTESFMDEGPAWSPNGRVIVAFSGRQGVDTGLTLFGLIDLTGRNLQKSKYARLKASDPAWSPLLP